MADQPLAARTIKTRYNNVRGVFRAAVRDRLIGRDPTEAVRLPRQRRADASMTIPSIEDVGAFVTASDDSFRAFVALCAFAGLRLGEAAAVQVADVDFLRRQLTVARQVQRAGDRQVEIKAPKYGSERVIYLPDELATLLARHVEAHTFGRATDRWLFQGEPGDPPHQNTVGYWWRKTQAAAGLTGIRLHDLRHFYASGLIAARLRRRHRAARARSRVGDNDAADLRPPVADRRRPHPCGSRRSDAVRNVRRRHRDHDWAKAMRSA